MRLKIGERPGQCVLYVTDADALAIRKAGGKALEEVLGPEIVEHLKVHHAGSSTMMSLTGLSMQLETPGEV